MKNLLIVVLVLVVGVAALGYSRGWLNLNKSSNTDLQVDPAKTQHDKDAFISTVDEKSKSLKGRIAGLWTKTESLAGDEKTHAKKELAELETKHTRLENQLKELQEASSDRFESIKQDLSKDLEAVEKKIEELTQKLAK